MRNESWETYVSIRVAFWYILRDMASGVWTVHSGIYSDGFERPNGTREDRDVDVFGTINMAMAFSTIHSL